MSKLSRQWVPEKQAEWSVVLSQARLFETPCIVAHQAPLSMEFSRQDYWSGSPCPPLGDFPHPGNQTQVSWIAGRFFTIWATREALVWLMYCKRLLFMEGKKALFYMHWDSVLKDTHMWPLWGQCPREGYYIHVCVCELTVQIFCPFFNSNRATKCSLLTLACRKSGHPVLAGQYQERWQT